MEILVWLCSFALFALSGALLFHRAEAAPLCTGLPPSTLQVLDVKAATPEPTAVSAEDLNRANLPTALASRHKAMLSMSDFVAWFDITHRIVPRDDGSVCDAPTFVRMGFGASRRVVMIVRDAADNPCKRQRLLDHEAAHNAALDDAVDRFIDNNRDLFQAGMIALKQTPAPSADLAQARWETGMHRILDAARQQLLAQLRVASAEVDAAPSDLEDIDKGCVGKR